MTERSIIIVIIGFIFTVSVFFENQYYKTGQLSGTSRMIDLGGISQPNDPPSNTQKSRRYNFQVSKNNFNPFINPVRNQIYRTREETFHHWEENLQALLNLQGDIEGQARKIQRVVEYDIERVRQQFPEIERILNDQKELFGYILTRNEFSEEGQKDYILLRLNDSIKVNPAALIQQNEDVQSGLNNLLENRLILQESIELGYEAIDQQLESLHVVGDQNLTQKMRRSHLRTIEKRQKVLVENLKLSYNQLDVYQKAIDDYVAKVVKEYNAGQLNLSLN